MLINRDMNPLAYKLIGILVVVAALFGAGYKLGYDYQEKRVLAVTSELADFKARVDEDGKQAQTIVENKAAADKLLKEKTDEASQRAVAAVIADNDKLRKYRARTGYVPAASPGSKRPNVACFDRAKLESAIQLADAGISELIKQGDECRVSLDSAKTWAAAR